MGLTPTTRSLAGSALAGLLVGTAFFLTLRSADRTRSLSARRSDTAQALTVLAQGLSDLKDAETGQRGYLLTGDPAYLAPYEQGRMQAKQALATFGQLDGARALPAADLAKLEGLGAQKLEELDRTIQLAQGGKRDEALAIVKAGGGLTDMDAIRNLHASLATDLERLKAGTDTALAEERLRLRRTLLLLGGLIFLTLGSGVWVLYRGDRRRLMAEHSLAAAESKLRLMVDGIRDYAILMLDPEGRVISWNAGAARIKGYEGPEILGESFSRFYPPESLAAGRPAQMLAQARETGRVEEEGWRVRKDGSRFWADTVITALRGESGGLLGFVKVTQDLTDRRRIEEELRASERRFRTLAEAAPVGIYEFDFERGTIYANEAHCRLAGVPKEGVTREQLRAAVHPEDRPRILAQVEAAMGGGLPCDQIYRLLHRDGTILWVHSRGTPIEDRPGHIVAYLIVTQDITAVRAAEAEVLAKAAALEASNKELEAFAYSVSHDLRAPLRHIDGFVNLLRKSVAEGESERAKRHMDVISTSARQMGALIDDLLSFSRMGRTEVHKTDFDLATLTRRVVEELAPDTAGRDIEWRFGDLPRVHGDPALLRLVLLNLLGNALKFTRGRPRASIEVSASVHGDRTAITVKDNGAGFDMRYADKLFGVFQRLHSQEEFEGTGIGLANVARIIHKHGGAIAAEGAVGQGAAFTFTLPLEASCLI